ncbi:hypothetical protein EAE90_18490 [Photorhabdus caribbeanensis]|nr:hypothetical protein [Photorhabdus caribbeanensis]
MMLSKCFIKRPFNDQLKSISQIEHLCHRSVKGFILTVLGGIIVYCLKKNKPSLNISIRKRIS